MARRRSRGDDGLNAWPGYVDALSTLLMVIIFVLLVFVLAQAFLSVALTGRDRALDRVNRQMAELSDMLSLERGRSTDLRASMAQLNRDLATATSTRDTLTQALAGLRADQQRLATERDGLRAERDRLSARLADTDVQIQSAQSRADALQAQAAEAAKRGDVTAQDAATIAARLTDTNRQLAARSAALADAQRQIEAAQGRLEEMRRQATEMDQTVRADRATIEARLSDLAKMTEQTRALTALRDDLERQVRETAVRATTEEQQRAAIAAQLADEKRLGETGRAQIALLNRQMDELRGQMTAVSRALEVAESTARDKDVQIANLGSRLNAALAQKVEELQRYRSDFFGRLREVLANRPGIQVVGDRFVFQSEVLFPVGGADLSMAGSEQILRLADTVKELSAEIPPDVNWLLRVDGHADRQPVTGTRFASNWELSASRAITVVKLLVLAGVPANRLAATGFGDNQPLDGTETPDAYARNRRIELRLTDR
jgi:chemotaxis protein MotB